MEELLKEVQEIYPDAFIDTEDEDSGGKKYIMFNCTIFIEDCGDGDYCYRNNKSFDELNARLYFNKKSKDRFLTVLKAIKDCEE